MVEPSDTATSRSSLIPIEQWRTPRRSASARSSRKPARDPSGGPARPTVISPSTARPASRAAATSAGASVGRAAGLLRLVRHVDLHHDPRARRALGELVDEDRTIDRLPDVDDAGQRPHLARLELADEVDLGPRAADVGELGQELLRVVLADPLAPGGDRSLDGVRSEALRHRQHDDVQAAAGALDPIADRGQPLSDAARTRWRCPRRGPPGPGLT